MFIFVPKMVNYVMKKTKNLCHPFRLILSLHHHIFFFLIVTKRGLLEERNRSFLGEKIEFFTSSDNIEGGERERESVRVVG